jgi:Na+-driven multidrug efflux pump
MFDNGNGDMHMESYSFMGMHFFWWGSILIFALVLLVAGHRYRKRKRNKF